MYGMRRRVELQGSGQENGVSGKRLWPALQYLMLRLVDRLNIKNELDSAYSE